MATFNDLIQKTIRRLSMVNGEGVQLYAEDLIGDMLQHKFNIIFNRQFWPQFKHAATYTLDGTLGVVTADLTAILKDYEDIQFIFREGAKQPLITAPDRMNTDLLTGDTPKLFEANSSAAKVFNILPKEATGNILLKCRTKPADFSTASETAIPFDNDVLILGACFDYLEDDGSNPGATEKFRILFEDRLRQLEGMHNNKRIPLDPTSVGNIPNTWETV